MQTIEQQSTLPVPDQASTISPVKFEDMRSYTENTEVGTQEEDEDQEGRRL